MSLMAAEATGLDEPALAAARRRSRWTLFLGVALGSTGHIAAVTVATIVGQDLLGSPTLAGAPGATVVLGAAAGAISLSSLMARGALADLGKSSGWLARNRRRLNPRLVRRAMHADRTAPTRHFRSSGRSTF